MVLPEAQPECRQFFQWMYLQGSDPNTDPLLQLRRRNYSDAAIGNPAAVRRGSANDRGYELEDFTDGFSLYLPGSPTAKLQSDHDVASGENL